MKKNHVYNCILILLSIGLISSLTIGINNKNKLLASNLNDYNQWREEHKETNVKQTDTIEVTSFYEKVNNKSNVKTLIIGDDFTIGNPNAAQPVTFDMSFNDMLKKDYYVTSTFQDIEEANATVSRGKELFDSTKNITDFDLAIISFVGNDYNSNTSLDKFAQDYTDLIGKIRSKNYNCTIIALIPPPLDNNNAFSKKIQSICKINNIDCINVLDCFNNSELQQNDLISNNLPTSLGYDTISSSISNLILKNN